MSSPCPAGRWCPSWPRPGCGACRSAAGSPSPRSARWPRPPGNCASRAPTVSWTTPPLGERPPARPSPPDHAQPVPLCPCGLKPWARDSRIEAEHHRGALYDMVLAEGADRGADGEELGGVRAPGVAVLAELDPDDPLRVQRLGLGLHAAHRQLPGVVEGLGELLDLHVAADVAEHAAQLLVGDVVDARAHHHAQRSVTGPDEGPEILPRQVGGERLVL